MTDLQETSMNEFQECLLMNDFFCNKQRLIVEETYADYNTSHPAGIKAALSNAAWQGFIAGLEAAKKVYARE